MASRCFEHEETSPYFCVSKMRKSYRLAIVKKDKESLETAPGTGKKVS